MTDPAFPRKHIFDITLVNGLMVGNRCEGKGDVILSCNADVSALFSSKKGAFTFPRKIGLHFQAQKVQEILSFNNYKGTNMLFPT